MNYPSNSDAIKKSTNLKHNNEAQFFVNELAHHYNLRCPKGVKPTMVFFVVRINGQQVRISTGLKVYPKYWDERACSGICTFGIFMTAEGQGVSS